MPGSKISKGTLSSDTSLRSHASPRAAVAGCRPATVQVSGRPQLILLELLEVLDGAKLDHSPVRVFVGLDLGESSHSLPDLSEFGEAAGLVREEEAEVVDDFVDGEIEDGQVSEVEVVGHALPLVQLHQVLDFPLVQLIQLLPSI